MAGRNPASAVRAFVAPLQAALGCFADGKVTADTYGTTTDGVLTLNNDEQVRLFGQADVSLSVSLRYRVVSTSVAGHGPWKVNTLGYMYDLRVNGASEIEYHWHPFTGEALPHLHCTKILKGHVPTGRILVEDVLHLAIEYGARPRDEKRWERIDSGNRARFALGARWGITAPPA